MKLRSIVPEIRTSQTIGSLSLRQRDLWHGLIATVDDQGRMLAVPAFVRSRVWPYDDFTLADVTADLDALEAAGMIARYEAAGRSLLQIVNWWKYQCASNWASPSEHPAPDGWVDRVRYHSKGRKLITRNWDKSGGYVVNYVVNYKDSYEGQDDNDNDNEDDNDNEEEEEEPKIPPAAPAAPPPPDNFDDPNLEPLDTMAYIREVQKIPNPQTTKQAEKHPMIIAYREVTGYFPPFSEVPGVISAMLSVRATVNTHAEFLNHLTPYWVEWTDRKYKTNNPAWLTDWAYSGVDIQELRQRRPRDKPAGSTPAEPADPFLAAIHARMKQLEAQDGK